MITTMTEFPGVAISHGEYLATVEKIAKVNARAAKRGFTGRLEVVAQREERTHTNEFTGISVTEVVYVTRVTGDAPSYGGYTFLARIDRVGDSFVIANAPGVAYVDRSLVHAGECDHCGFNRQRNNTYLVVNDETGEAVNVGSTCIKDFLGWSASVVFFGEGDSDLEVEIGGGHYAPEYRVDTILAFAYAAIRAFGWVPASDWDRKPTRSYVSLALASRRLTDEERAQVAALRPYAEEATAKVAEIKAYLLSDEFSGTSTYVDNLKVLAAQDVATERQFGLLTSAPQAYIRHLEGQAERKAKEARPVSEFLGQEKEKVTVTGVIEAVRFIPGNYGTTVLYTIVTDEGNQVKWFASREALGEETGRRVTLQGTVKSHEDHERYGKSTVLTRCKEIS